MAGRTQKIPTRTTQDQEARQRFIEDMRSESVPSRMAAMRDLIGYFERTVNPPQLDTHAFPILKFTRREDAIEAGAASTLDTRFFPVIRYKKRLEVLNGFVPQLIERMNDSDSRVRACAVYLLGQLSAREALPQLRQLSQSDRDELVRSWAASAVETIGRR
jgi:hypothetical protein